MCYAHNVYLPESGSESRLSNQRNRPRSREDGLAGRNARPLPRHHAIRQRYASTHTSPLVHGRHARHAPRCRAGGAVASRAGARRAPADLLIPALLCRIRAASVVGSESDWDAEDVVAMDLPRTSSAAAAAAASTGSSEQVRSTATGCRVHPSRIARCRGCPPHTPLAQESRQDTLLSSQCRPSQPSRAQPQRMMTICCPCARGPGSARKAAEAGRGAAEGQPITVGLPCHRRF